MTSHSSALVAGLVCLSTVVVVVPMPWLAAEAAGESSIGREGCNTSCGGVDIPFPFGMGPGHCWLPGFEISCNYTYNGVLKPFMVTRANATAPKDAITQVLNISLEQGEAKVLNGISSYCYDNASRKMVPSEWRWSLVNYSYSSTANKFTVVGCRALAYIGDTRGGNAARYQTGCVSTCFDGKMSLNPCSGMGCCQTPFPKGLRYFKVWFDEGFTNISGIDDGPDLFGRCSFAVLMDSSNFTLSTSSSNISSPEELSAFNTYRGGMAPVVLDWSIGDDDDNCTTAPTKPGYACVSSNSFCYNAASGRGYICRCNQGFDGNPYLTDGCQDIDECAPGYPRKCYGVCTNTIGS